MTRYYVPGEANTLLPAVVPVVDRLRAERADLVGLRDAYRSRLGAVLGVLPGEDEAPDPLAGDDRDDPDLRRLRLRMRGIVDRMQADAAWLDERSIVLRDIATGLLDFPALVDGLPAWLCWRSGEDAITWWHPHESGFAGRRPIEELGVPDPSPTA